MDVISVSDAARILQASESSVRYWTKTGQLPAMFTPRGQRLYLRCDVEALARKRADR